MRQQPQRTSRRRLTSWEWLAFLGFSSLPISILIATPLSILRLAGSAFWAVVAVAFMALTFSVAVLVAKWKPKKVVEAVSSEEPLQEHDKIVLLFFAASRFAIGLALVTMWFDVPIVTLCAGIIGVAGATAVALIKRPPHVDRTETR